MNLTPRQKEIFNFLNEEPGRLWDPKMIAAVISRRGIPTHPSAAGKALRKLAARKVIKAVKAEGRVVATNDLRLVSQGAKEFSEVSVYNYTVPVKIDGPPKA